MKEIQFLVILLLLQFRQQVCALRTHKIFAPRTNLNGRFENSFPAFIINHARRTPSERFETILFSKMDDESSKSIEPKYLGAVALFLFACLYDFFITHHGMPNGWEP